MATQFRPLLAATFTCALLSGALYSAEAQAFCGTISGLKFHDVNVNGIYDPGTDPPLQGWNIRLIDGRTGAATIATTGPGGVYTFNNVDCGIYTVVEETQTGWTQTTPPDPGYWLIDVEFGDNYTNLNFGNEDSVGQCPDVDLNINLATGWDDDNGQLYPQNTDDNDWMTVYSEAPVFPPLPRPPHVVSYPWPQLLNPGTSQPIAIDLQGRNGEYTYQRCFCLDTDFTDAEIRFDLTVDDEADIYLNGALVASTPPTGFTVLTSVLIDNQALFQPGVNCLDVATRNTGRVVTGFNMFGAITADSGTCCLPEPAKITGEKYLDLDADGVNSGPPTDYPIAGWDFDLTDTLGTTFPTQTSGTMNSINGFGWCGLPPGNYTATEQQQNNFTATNGLSQSATLSFGDSAFFEFGNAGPVCDLVGFDGPQREGCCIGAEFTVGVDGYFTLVRAIPSPVGALFDVNLTINGLNTGNGWVLQTATPTLFEWYYDPQNLGSPQPIPRGVQGRARSAWMTRASPAARTSTSSWSAPTASPPSATSRAAFPASRASGASRS